jgi:origin recognition complex subunit 1
MMKDAHRKGELPKFQFVEVNGMRLQKPEQAYSIIWEALSGDFLAPTKALSRIEDHITNRKRSSVRSDGTRLLILVDELDHMRTKTELVLYNLFDWPMQPDAGICVVAIANIMDFPERLKSSVRSRIGKNRLVFRPYNVKVRSGLPPLLLGLALPWLLTQRYLCLGGPQEVETILMNRLAELPRVFKPEALQIAARKVASASGDVRSALQMCSRALEVCRGRGAKQVEIEDINKAARLIKNSPVVEAIQLGTPIERHIMAAVASVIFTTGAGDRGVQMELVHSRAEMTAKISGLSSLRMSLKEVAEVVNRLSHMGVLRQMQGDGRLPLVGINMQESLSIPQMLKDDKHALGAIPDDMRPRASAMSTFHR